MSKKYLITKAIAGEEQGFLKNVTKDGGEWINDHNEALTFLNLKDAENEKELLFSKLGAEHKDIAHIRIIEL